MELNMPGWMVSPLSLNNHITAPQHNAAKRENLVASGGMGFTEEEEGDLVEYGAFARGRNDATTREQT